MVGILKKPVTVAVKEAFAVRIGPEATRFDGLLSAVNKREAYNIAEFGVGCSPNSRLIGIILEDEKVYGTVHVALGDNIGSEATSRRESTWTGSCSNLLCSLTTKP
jgi:aminopeptidase